MEVQRVPEISRMRRVTSLVLRIVGSLLFFYGALWNYTGQVKQEARLLNQRNADLLSYEVCLCTGAEFAPGPIHLKVQRVDDELQLDEEIELTAAPQHVHLRCATLDAAGRLPVGDATWTFSIDRPKERDVLRGQMNDLFLTFVTYHPGPAKWYESEHFLPNTGGGAWVLQVNTVVGSVIVFKSYEGAIQEFDNRVRSGEGEVCAASRGIDLGGDVQSVAQIVPRRAAPAARPRRRVRSQQPVVAPQSTVSLGVIAGNTRTMHVGMAGSTSMGTDSVRGALGYKQLTPATEKTKRRSK